MSHATADLGEATSYRFSSGRLGRPELDVASFRGTEAISEPYSYEIVLATDLSPESAEEALFARPARFVLASADRERIVVGVVRSVESRGATLHAGVRRSTLAVELVPRLALLAERTNSRVFQDVDVSGIVATLLREWRIPLRLALAQTYAPWAYCVQYQESDLAFLQRILAAEGIHYFFELEDADDPESKERVVLGDAPSASESVAGDPPALRVVDAGAMAGGRETLSRFSRQRTVAPTSTVLRDYWPDNARFDVRAEGSSEERAEDAAAGSAPLRAYDFLPARPMDADRDGSAMSRTLAMLRRNAATFRGEGNCRRLAAGHRLSVDDGAAPVSVIVTRLSLKGQSAWHATTLEPVFEAAFEAVSVSSSIAPPRLPHRRHQGLDTATVVGPAGFETHTDSLGRIRVHFRWDLERPPTEDASCWIRVAQGWAGPGFGVHFLPRVGMEVLVGYLDGDVNRPLVIGCVPNSANPVPFPLPAGQAKSGVVTRTLLGAGFHELSFDDTRGQERIDLRSERDMHVLVQRNLSERTGRDETTSIGRDLHHTVGRERTTTVSATDRLEVGGTQWTEVKGNRVSVVEGHDIARLAVDRTIDVGAHSRVFVGGDRVESVRGTAEDAFEGDHLTRSHGCVVTVVGIPDAKRSWLLHVDGDSRSEATGDLTLRSEQSVRFVCGESEIVMTPEAIHFSSPNLVLAGAVVAMGPSFAVRADDLATISSTKVGLYSTDGASVRLTEDALVDGAKVKLKPGPESVDGFETETSTPTTIRLEDQDGVRIPGERYVLRLPDGSIRSGVLDEHGEVTLFGITGACEVDFPELRGWGPAPVTPGTTSAAPSSTSAETNGAAAPVDS